MSDLGSLDPAANSCHVHGNTRNPKSEIRHPKSTLRMAFTVNGELVEDSVIRAEASALRPRYEEVARNMDPIEAEMQLRDWSRENVIERILLRQEAASDPEPVSAEAIEQTL